MTTDTPKTERASVDMMREALRKCQVAVALYAQRCRDGENTTKPFVACFDVFEIAREALAAPPQAAEASMVDGWSLKRLKDTLDSRLNDYLCEMKEGYDDSIVGFNEAWDVVRKTCEDALAAAPSPPEIGEEEIVREMHRWLKWSRPYDECSLEVRAAFNEGARSILALIKRERGG